MGNVDIFNIAMGQFEYFILIVIRITAIFFTAPILSSRNIPSIVKIAAAALTGLIIFPVIDKTAAMPSDIMTFGLLVFKQVIMGVIVGLAAYMVFAAIQLAGQIIDLQMGFGIVNVIDPVSNTQVSIMGQFQFVLGILIFLSINGHHFLFRAISDSFYLVPLNDVGVTTATVNRLSDLFYNMFVLAFKIAGPATIALFLTNLTLGLVARTLPQMNVFIVGLPLNILVGISAVLIALPILVNLFSTLLNTMWEDIYFIIRSMRV
ncbi:MAG TPA: flagellar biosynthetic protein FliR [Candidatus Goldiibacteriota bacterium]|nr:flagellar biosynthetic protein FliR [Candidatus Goldiibacteriota bacterium]HPI03036.1 flagellar biosynthetic protein FliR [Candidatus Goldiibacteriota bacterium]HRQ43911.1 flagellar biosynthetic protein FliR [Candidatus Goldiibacteriota bacterium]